MTNYLPIPHTESDFNREFQQSRLSHSNVTDPTPRENVLKSIRCTSQLKRNTNQAFILIVGNTGCGKSSTINHLFALTRREDRLTTLASVNDEESETRSVQEYLLQCDDHHYQIKDATLSVIDTPGFNDTAGIKQNACNMHSIKSFMDKHPNLMNQKPNLVFICLNVNDNRFKGVHSNFSKSLRILKNLDVIDVRDNNVIGVITHVCSTSPPHTRHEAWTNKMNEKIESFQTIIQQILNINDAPIVLIENSFEDAELERPTIEGGGYSDYTRLPNGELQPRNLFVACSDTMIRSKDSLGKILFDACFVAGNTEMKVTKGLEIKANIAADQELTREETKILSWLSEMETCTETALENPNVCNLEQFISHSTSEHPIQRINTLNKGYDILLGKINVAEIFKVDYRDIGLGVNVPTSCTFEMLNETTDVMKLFESREVLMKQRLQDFNVKTNINCAILNFEIGGGYNYQVGHTMDTNSRSYSFLREHRLAKLNMGDFASLQLTENFKQSVETLPSQFNSSLDDKLMFERFFNHWGHYVVTSVYIGGSVTGYVKSCSRRYETFESIREKFNVAIGCSIIGLGISQQSGHDESLMNQLGISISELQWRGGDTRLHSTGTLSDTNKFDQWRNSVNNQPIVLSREMHLEPIATMIGLISRDKQRAAELAASHFYKVKLDAVNREREELLERQNREKVELTRRETVQNHRQKDEGCFSLNGQVQIRDIHGNVKQISLNKLEIGQRVLAWNQFNNDCIYSDVIAFADFESTKLTPFLQFTLENGNVLSITGNHLIVIEYNGKVVPARNVKVNDTLVVMSSSDNVMSTESSRVLSIDSTHERGYLAPVTMSGNLFVNGVLSSCYANVNDVELFGKFTVKSQNIAHMAFLPLRCYYRLVMKNWSAEKKKKRMHPYVKWLLSLNVPRKGAHCLLFD